jgi:hypothetical protein
MQRHTAPANAQMLPFYELRADQLTQLRRVYAPSHQPPGGWYRIALAADQKSMLSEHVTLNDAEWNGPSYTSGHRPGLSFQSDDARQSCPQLRVLLPDGVATKGASQCFQIVTLSVP